MAQYRMLLEYDGTEYHGWQLQPDRRTLQGVLETALATALRHPVRVAASGRTDAGVHALGQVAHLDVSTNLPAEALRRRLNDELPADINILAAAQVPHRFHARHDAVARRYLYQIARRRTAFAKPFIWWVKEPLDLTRMQAAATSFVGMQDFQSFAAKDEDGGDKSTLVLVERLDVTSHGDLILITIEGSHLTGDFEAFACN